MLVFLLTLLRFARALWRGLRDPEFRGLLFLVGVLLLSGVLFYRSVEGWSTLDSVYFSVATLTTVGYGDLAPTTVASKVFTIIYIVLGVGVLLAFVAKVATNVLGGQQQLREKLQHRRTGGDNGGAASD
jgi:hypothetical protein